MSSEAGVQDLAELGPAHGTFFEVLESVACRPSTGPEPNHTEVRAQTEH